MKTKLIAPLIILTVFSMLCTACGLMSSVIDERDDAWYPEAPATVENEATTQGAPRSETTRQPQEQTSSTSISYPIVDTGQSYCYSDAGSISCPDEGQSFFGQDAQFNGNQPRYQDNEDGTVTDLITGLMWQGDPGEKMTYEQAVANESSFRLAGYDDWRLPTIKELYSLVLFSGTDVSICAENGSCTAIPFIDSDFFKFEYGDADAGERTIDSQWATSTLYTGTVFGGQQAMFGVNFADGRIKGYPAGLTRGGPDKTFFVIHVRGNPSYGINDFIDNGNGTITDRATGLTWMQNDSGEGLDWEEALHFCANMDFADTDDWRLPNAKELHSIVDYSRSPDATQSAAIDSVFSTSILTNEAGQPDYPAFWSSSTHLSSNGSSRAGVYIAFGRALGYMNGDWLDVHGAGAQRAEVKNGDPSRYPSGHGPQGDAVRIYNYARCVAGGTEADLRIGGTMDDTLLPPEQDSGADNQPALSGPQSPQGGASREQSPRQASGQPPQEAISACTALSQGSACSMNTINGTIAGSCMVVPTGQLACVPAGAPPGAVPGSH